MLKINLKSKLIISFLIAVVIPYVAASLFIIKNVEKSHDELVRSHFHHLLDQVGKEVENVIFSGLANMKLLARNPIMQSQYSLDKDKLEQMKIVQGYYKLFDDISLVSLDGIVQLSTDYNYKGQKKYKDWYKKAKLGESAVSPAHIVLTPYRVVVTATAPVYDNNQKIVALLGGQINLNKIWEIVDQVKEGYTGRLYVFDKKGNYVAASDKDLILTKFEPKEVRDKILNAEEGSFVYREGNSDKVVSFIALNGYKDYPGQGWKIAVIQDDIENKAIINGLKNYVLLVAGMGLIIILLIAGFLSRHLTRPLNLLSRAAEKIEVGDLTTRVNIYTNDELKDLGEAFNKMAEGLNRTTVSLEVLQEEQKRFQDVAASSGDWIFEVDKDGRYTYVSEAVEKVLGFQPKEMLKKYYWDFYCPKRVEMYKAEIEKHFMEKTVIRHFLSCSGSKEGKQVFLETSATPIFDKYGKFIGYRGVNHDVTEIKNAEENLRKAYNDLEKTHAQLVQSEKLAALGQLAAGVAHEINNPLGFINNNLEVFQNYSEKFNDIYALIEAINEDLPKSANGLLKDNLHRLNDLEKEVKMKFMLRDLPELLSETKSGIDRIKKIVVDLGAFSRSTEDTLEVTNYEDIVNNVLNIIESEVKKKADLIADFRDIPAILVNKQRMSQVILNLLINSCQAIKERGRIIIKAFKENNDACLSISDNGCGISKDDLEKIFDPFFTTKPVGQGTGLGLSVSYEIVKRYNGHIKVISEIDKGSEFVVVLPVYSKINKLKEKQA